MGKVSATVAVAIVAVLFLACGNTEMPTSGVGKGSLALTLQPSGSEADGVMGFKIEVYSGQTFLESDYVLLSSGHLPSGFVPDAGNAHDYASKVFILVPGSYHVKAHPMKSETVPSSVCVVAETDVVVMENDIATISLVSECTGINNGGLEVVATLNNSPQILDVEYNPSEFVPTCQNLDITLTAQDPDGDALTYQWTVTNAPSGSSNTHSVDLERSSLQYLSIDDNAQTGLDVFSALTFETWVKFESLPQQAGNTFGLISKYNSGSSYLTRQYSWSMAKNGSDLTLGIEVYGDAEPGDQKSQVYNGFVVDTWYHLAVTWNGSTKEFKFYIGGLQVGSTQTGTTVSQITDKNLNFEIGIDDAQHYSNRFFDGKMDEVRVWNVERTASEISTNMNASINTATGLVGSWHLNNSLVDSSGNGNTLTNNAATFTSDVPFTGASYTSFNVANIFSFTAYAPGNYTVQAKVCDILSATSCSTLNLPIHALGSQCEP